MSGIEVVHGFTVVHIYAGELKRLFIPIPPADEQAAIVRFLDHADRKIHQYIRTKKQLITLLNEQKQAIVHRAITRGLDLNVKMKSTTNQWFPEVPSSWQVIALRRVVRRAVDGPHHSPKYLDEGIPFLSARNIRVDRWSLADAKYISQADYAEFSRRIRPEVGDVLYTKGGTTGVARVVDLDFPFQVWVHVAVLKLDASKIDANFLALALNSRRCYEQAQLLTRGATNQDLGLNRMQSIIIPLPKTLGEQIEIVERVTRQTRSLSSAQKQAEKEIILLREYRTRLVADVVTGKLDVREAAAKLPEIAADSSAVDEMEVLLQDDAMTEGLAAEAEDEAA